MTKRPQMPLVFKLILPLLTGIVFAFYTLFVLDVFWLYIPLAIMGICSLPIFSVRLYFTYLFSSASSIFFLLLGIYLVNLNEGWRHELYFIEQAAERTTIFQGRLLEPPIEKSNSFKLVMNIEKVGSDKTVGKTIVYFEKSPAAFNLKYGDIVLFKTIFNRVRVNGNPEEFDFLRYLRLHNIYHQAYVKKEAWNRVGNSANAFYTLVYTLKSYFEEILVTSDLLPTNLMVAKALILGEKDSLDRDTLRAYSSAGAMHILAVSGLHVGIVMLLFSLVLKPLKRLPKGKVIFLFAVLFIIWSYAFITGMSSSVVRASVMFSFVLVGKELERDTSVYQSILISAFLMLLFEPVIIFHVGFQLSYLAVLGIVYIHPKVYNLFCFKRWLFDKVWQITSVSLAAQIATFPLGLYYFHQFPNFFLVSNLIVIPLAFVILIVGILFLFFSAVPFLSDLLRIILNLVLSGLNKGVQWVESLPNSIYWGVSIQWFEVFWYYLIIVFLIYAFVFRKAKILLVTLSFFVLLIAFNFAKNAQLGAKNSLVIYNVNKDLAIDIFYGRQNTFIGSSALIEDEDKLLFHIMHNWFYRTGSETPTEIIAYDMASPIIEIGNYTLFLWSDSTGRHFPNRIPQTDFIYFTDTKFVRDEMIIDINARQIPIILGHGNSYHFINTIKNKLTGNLVHDLRTDGAFEIDFTPI